MESKEWVEIDLVGSIPSKKNSRITTRSGASIPSKEFYEWQENAIKETRAVARMMFLKPVRIDVIFYFGTFARSDADNKLTSILDMLVEARVLKDDKWLDVPNGSYQSIYRKGEPGAKIRIVEI